MEKIKMKDMKTEDMKTEDLKNEELIAVITAAIAAYEGESAMSNLIIRKIDRVAGYAPAWGVEGNREQIDSRRM